MWSTNMLPPHCLVLQTGYRYKETTNRIYRQMNKNTILAGFKLDLYKTENTSD